MPIISRYGCNQCDFEMPSGWGGYTYAVNDRGERIVCPHPGEFRKIWEVTGLGYFTACWKRRVGCASYCVCLDCLAQFDLDWKRDKRVCPKCLGFHVSTLRKMIGKRCPQCKSGTIEEGSPIRWKLDPDWEQLPVPQIVKDLTEFEETRRVPESLREAARIAASYRLDKHWDKHNLFIVVLKLLQWWEGNFFLDQQESLEMQPEWKWGKPLPGILSVTPALAELVVIRDGRCWFADSVTPEMRRGIKNYLRKNRKHVVMS